MVGYVLVVDFGCVWLHVLLPRSVTFYVTHLFGRCLLLQLRLRFIYIALPSPVRLAVAVAFCLYVVAHFGYVLRFVLVGCTFAHFPFVAVR